MTLETKANDLAREQIDLASTRERNLNLQRQLDEANRLSDQLKQALRLALDGLSTVDEPTEHEPKGQ